MKSILAATALVGAFATAAVAEEGAYFGLGLAAVKSSSNAAPIRPGYDASANDFGLALTAGFRFASAGTLTYGVEGNLDLMTGNRMKGDPADSCLGQSPTWCEIDAAFRLRGTLTTDLANGNRLTASLGAVIVRGLVESGPGNNVSAMGRGISVGVAWESVGSGMPLRVDLNYDAVSRDNVTAYERSLDMIGLRVSYMF